ncbi:MAG: outer membrane beta-barrel protein [Flavobacteriales bacterium]
MRISFFILSCAFTLCTPLLSTGQLTLNINQFRPTGELGKGLENKIGFGAAWVQPFEDVWRSSIGLSFFKFDTRMDVFPVVGTISSGGNTFVSLGEQRFEKYNLIALDFMADYAIVERDQFILFGGLGIFLGATSVAYTAEYPEIKSESYSGGDRWFGLAGRVGVELPIGDTFAVRASADRKYFVITENGYYSANQIQLGFSYYFN